MASPEQPNIANLNSDRLQSLAAHQQTLDTELPLFRNVTPEEIHQQLNTIEAKICQLIDLSTARGWNMNAKLENGNTHQVTGGLVTMRSVNIKPDAQVPINHPIPNFPRTAGGIPQLTAIECRNILTALDCPIATAPSITARHLRTAVRQAIGLPGL